MHKEIGECGSHIMIYMVIDRIGDICICVCAQCVYVKKRIYAKKTRQIFFFVDFYIFIFEGKKGLVYMWRGWSNFYKRKNGEGVKRCSNNSSCFSVCVSCPCCPISFHLFRRMKREDGPCYSS